MHNYFEFCCISHFVLQLFFYQKNNIRRYLKIRFDFYYLVECVTRESSTRPRSHVIITKISRNRLMGTKNCWQRSELHSKLIVRTKEALNQTC